MTPSTLPLIERRALRRGQAAYTAVEVLMSLAVLAVGVVGIIATDKVTLAANQHAKNLSIATRIADSWMGVLSAEAVVWESQSNRPLRTTWLAQGAGTTDWFRPTYSAQTLFGPAFDALGNPVPVDSASAAFCVDVRLWPLNADNDGGGLIRAEVRVLWLRQETVIGATAAPAQACGITTAAATAGTANDLAHFVFMSSAVRQAGR